MEVIIGLIGVAVMLFLIALGVPIAFAMGFSGLAGFAWLWGAGTGIQLAITTAFTTLNSFVLVCVPLFIFMGQTLFHCGIAKDLFGAFHKWLSRIPGGLVMAVTVTSAGFASVCGSSSATVATMAAVALPEMNRYNYSPRLATGCIAAAGTLGILIPPSIPMVIYGVMTEQSIGRLFLAGIVPGIISAALYMIMISIRTMKNPSLAPPGIIFSWTEKLIAISKVWSVAVIFISVMGGIYLGFFTPTEAAAVGALLALLIGFGQRRVSKMGFYASFAETVSLSGMILGIMAAAMVFASFIVTTGLPATLVGFVVSLEANRYVVLVAMLVIYLIMGCVLNVLAILVITIPLFLPIVLELGFNPIWFGIILTKMIEVALITPPIGFNCLIVKNVSGGYASISDVFAGVGWFFVMDIITIAILVVFPQISLFLPNLMYQ